MKQRLALLLAVMLCLGIFLVPVSAASLPFTDVKSGAFYYDSVVWAVEKEITTGTTPTTFGPDEICTRNQVVTFLWRAAGKPEPATTINPFVDVAESDYCYKAVLWAVEKGITNGMDATHFGAKEQCTRAQVATFLWRAKGMKAPSATTTPFQDVDSGSFYYKAVLWAVEEGITTGTSATTFDPGDSCTRGQIVTFLYRAFKAPVHTHTYTSVVTAPTCTEDGYTTHTCSVCGDTFTDTPVDALGHSYTSVITAPTCTEDGYTTHTCSVCGDTFTDTPVDALGHSWDAGSVTTPATESVEGLKVYTCTVCGATKDEVLPKLLAIAAQPGNVVGITGETATFTVTVINAQEPVTYAWEYRDSGMAGFAPITSTDFSGIDTGTLSVVLTDTLMNCNLELRCVITDGLDRSITSDAAKVSPYEEFKVLTHPADLTLSSGQTGVFTIEVTGGVEPYTYAWEYTNDLMGGTYDAVGNTLPFAAGADTDTLTVTANDTLLNGGYVFRCAVSDARGSSVLSWEARPVKAIEPMRVVLQPADTKVAIGGVATFSAAVEGGKPDYVFCWQYQAKPTEEFTDVKGDESWFVSAADGELKVRFTEAMITQLFAVRCVIEDSATNSVTTDAACGEFLDDLAIISQSYEVPGEVGETVSFSVAVIGGQEEYTYQWFTTNNDLADWLPVPGATKATVSVELVQEDMEKELFMRCRITDQQGWSIDSADMWVVFPLTITRQPVNDDTANVGDEAIFSVGTLGGWEDPSYQWQYAESPADAKLNKWKDIETGKAAVLALEITDLNYVYRCIVTDGYDELITDTVEAGPLRIVVQPADFRVTTVGAAAKHTVEVRGGMKPYTYRWFYSFDGGTNYQIANEATGHNISTPGTILLGTNSVYAAMDWLHFCEIRDAADYAVSTREAKIIYPLTVKTQPESRVVSLGHSTLLEVEVTGGVKNYTYEWVYRSKSSDGNVWFSVSSLDGFSGSSVSKLSIDNCKEEYYGYYYKCIITDKEGTRITTDQVELSPG